jgi:hypothetical protein
MSKQGRLSNRTRWLILTGFIAVLIFGLHAMSQKDDRDVENFKQAQLTECLHDKQFGHELGAAMWADTTHSRYEGGEPVTSGELAECRNKAGLG